MIRNNGMGSNYVHAASQQRILLWNNEDDTCKSKSAKQDELSAESIRTYISKIRKDLLSAKATQFNPFSRSGQYKLADCLFEDLDLFEWCAR